MFRVKFSIVLLVQLPNGVLGVKRVLGYGKRFIVDYVTWTCPEPKSAGCPLGTVEEFFLQPKQNGPHTKFVMSLKLPLFATMAHMVANRI